MAICGDRDCLAFDNHRLEAGLDKGDVALPLIGEIADLRCDLQADPITGENSGDDPEARRDASKNRAPRDVTLVQAVLVKPRAIGHALTYGNPSLLPIGHQEEEGGTAPGAFPFAFRNNAFFGPETPASGVALLDDRGGDPHVP